MAAVTTVAMSSAASALTITNRTADCELGSGTSVTCGTDDRRDLSVVELGESVGNDFFSLGLGGTAEFEIAPNFTGPLTALEVTNGRERYYTETADVFGRNTSTGMFELLGSVSNTSAVSTINFAGSFDAIRFTDTTIVPGNRTGDGYDLAAFTVAAVPLPAGGLLLIGGLGALGVASRRRRKAA
ncbi:hypothetical protein OCH239_12740 [Roseivivax halodurans JCM 10272]|uniref:VPLPA-CTERM protein sorting domain-containing protein n=2 Tax=Roseivivax halodurans TaxID=93683 RepID=X7EAX3_9RHOB|nr:hypothetical protein OCH239_12740 [Roseivivax halodurans JCM 10272]